jgi:RecA-family ATPase
LKPVLVILDPLVAYLGDIDMHRSNQTRPLMAALKTVAERHTCTVLGVRHPSKLDQGGPLMYRGQGNMPTFKGVWSRVVNFAPLPPPDTRPGQYPRHHRRADDNPGYHVPGG